MNATSTTCQYQMMKNTDGQVFLIPNPEALHYATLTIPAGSRYLRLSGYEMLNLAEWAEVWKVTPTSIEFVGPNGMKLHSGDQKQAQAEVLATLTREHTYAVQLLMADRYKGLSIQSLTLTDKDGDVYTFQADGALHASNQQKAEELIRAAVSMSLISKFDF